MIIFVFMSFAILILFFGLLLLLFHIRSLNEIIKDKDFEIKDLKESRQRIYDNYRSSQDTVEGLLKANSKLYDKTHFAIASNQPRDNKGRFTK